MELIALLEALKYSEKNFKNEDFEFYTDSAYIYNCIKDKWYLNWIRNNWKNSKKEPVLNKDLWELIIPYFSKENYSFFKVKGHTGKKDWNNEVDKMAQNAAQYLISN